MTYNLQGTWQIEHQCPQCGAPVILEETDRIFLCPYCRTKLYLIPNDYFRYFIAPADATSREIIYIPYWRLKGLSFSIQHSEVSHRFVDTNILALTFPGVPSSLGLRPQVFRLKFASPEISGTFFNPQISVREVMDHFGAPDPLSIYHTFIGETVNLIYSPMYLENNVLYDSILKRPVYTLETGDSENLMASRASSRGNISFISTLCAQCGWDLQGEKDAMVLICRNCDSAWSCRGNAFTNVAYAIMANGESVSHYLPFWRMRARIEGIRLESYGDLIRAGNLPKAITRTFEETPLYFWCPAFKVNPALFLRWARQMTVSQPEEKSRELSQGMSLYPATLPISEAEESIMITIADIITVKRIIPLLPEIRIHVNEFLLVYHPFTSRQSELVHATMKLSIDKRSLAYGICL